MLLATINCFQVPYYLVFVDNERTDIMTELVNGVIDFFFILDVVINFRTSFTNYETGEEVYN